ncbi:hypothetical protein BJV82DRAFT_668593 [Fennellomyces sp. T-0311]|nr:hypothetical protein BJV82DRAFT_668593 [Fennellomyces sp. T-0311]
MSVDEEPNRSALAYLRQKETKGKSPVTRSAYIKSSLYKDLDRLERSLDADMQHLVGPLNNSLLDSVHEETSTKQDDSEVSILRELEQVPFVGDIRPPFGSRETSFRGLSDVSTHSDRDILGDILKKRPSRSSNGSKERYIPNQELVDEKYSVTPLVNPAVTTAKSRKSGSPSHQRAMSPGEYFGKRSLPLDSFDKIWDKPPAASPTYSHKNSISYNDDDMLLQSFKSLPHSLSHNYNIRHVNNTHASRRTQKHTSQPRERISSESIRFSTSLHDDNDDDDYVSIPVIRHDHKSDRTNAGVVSGTVRLRRIHAVDRSDTDIDEEYSTNDGGYEVEPQQLILGCKVSANSVQLGNSQLRIRNNYTHRSRSFSLFSSRGKLKFLQRQGVISAGGYVDIVVRLRRSAATKRRQSDASFETILILIDGKYSHQVDVDMELIDERVTSLLSDIGPPGDEHSLHHHSLHDHHSFHNDQPVAISTKPKCPFCVMEQCS